MKNKKKKKKKQKTKKKKRKKREDNVPQLTTVWHNKIIQVLVEEIEESGKRNDHWLR